MNIKQKLNATANGFRQHVPVYQSFVFAVQLIVVLILALLSPFLIRALCLPSLVQFKAPLHFTFFTCSDQLSGVCSYPTATVTLDEDEWRLTAGIQYDVVVELTLSEVENNRHLGPFQVIFEAFDGGGQRTTSYRRTAKVNEKRSLFSLVKYVTFLPLYLSGLWRQASQLDVRVGFSEKFIESTTKPTNSFTVQLQNRLAEIEEGTLVMSARFGLIRNFLFNWPLVSALVMFSVTFSLGISIVALYWALRGLAVYFKRCDETHIEQYEVRSGRASSADLSSGFHSYGSMDNLYEKEADSVFKSGYALKDATVRRAESQRVAAGEPSVWELLRKRKAPSDVDLGKRLPGTKGVAGWDMKSEATPEELAEFLKSLMKSSPQNLSNDVAKIIQSLIDGSLSAATVTVRLRKLVDLGDYPNFSAVLRRSLPALQESVRKGEVTMEGIRPLEVGAEIEQKTPRGERKVSESITTPLSTSSVNQSVPERTETVERRHSEPSDDELPECPVLTGIPGWDVVPEPILRRRLVHKRNSFSLT